jgi:hypothetical protein
MLGKVLPKQNTIVRADMDGHIPKPQLPDYAQCFIIVLRN